MFFDEREKLEPFYRELDENIPLRDPLKDDMNPLDHFIDVVLKDDRHNPKFYEQYSNDPSGLPHVQE